MKDRPTNSSICDYKETLSAAGLQVSAPRLAIASYVMNTQSHPTAEEVKDQVEKFFPTVSLATVYNTLNIFVEKGLLNSLKDQDSGTIRYDCNTSPHFHFIDEDSGKIYDVSEDVVKVSTNAKYLNQEFEVSSIDVTLRGKFKKPKKG